METITDYRVDIMGGNIEYKTNTGRWLKLAMTTNEGAQDFIMLADLCGVKNVVFAHELVGMSFESKFFPDET